PGVPHPELSTERLLLRRWRDRDREQFAALNADPVVMEHYPSLLTRAESDAAVDRIEASFDRRGFGNWAVEVPGVADFVGYIGLSVPAYDAPFMPAVEIGWRLDRRHWGRGYATEGARAALEFGFSKIGLHEIVSFTVPANVRSWRGLGGLGGTRVRSRGLRHPPLP